MKQHYPPPNITSFHLQTPRLGLFINGTTSALQLEVITSNVVHPYRDNSFMCVLSIKMSTRKKSGNLSYAPRRLCSSVSA